MTRPFMLFMPREVVENCSEQEILFCLRLVTDFSRNRFVKMRDLYCQFNVRPEKGKRLRESMGLGLVNTGRRQNRLSDLNGWYSAEAGKKNRVGRKVVEKKETGDSEAEERLKEYMGVYRCLLPDGKWRKPSAVREECLKRLRKPGLAANKDWDRFIEISRAFIRAIESGLIETRHQFEPQYWIHKQGKNPADQWTGFEYLLEAQEDPDAPVFCPRCNISPCRCGYGSDV